jgi:hypothetical protein
VVLVKEKDLLWTNHIYLTRNPQLVEIRNEGTVTNKTIRKEGRRVSFSNTSIPRSNVRRRLSTNVLLFFDNQLIQGVSVSYGHDLRQPFTKGE